MRSVDYLGVNTITEGRRGRGFVWVCSNNTLAKEGIEHVLSWDTHAI